jgi:hypothetical protein
VVVHTYTGVRDDLRLSYAGAIPSGGVDSDIWVPNLVVTLTEAGDQWARITVRGATARSITIVASEPSGAGLGWPRQTEIRRTPCGDEYRVGVWDTQLHMTYTARTRGYDVGADIMESVAITWTVGGTEIVTASGSVIVEVPFRGAAPLLGPLVTSEIDISVDPRTQALTRKSRGGDAYSTEVTATVGSPADPRTAKVFFAPAGTYDGIHLDDLHVLSDCIRRSIPVHVDVRDLFDDNPLGDPVNNPLDVALRARWIDKALSVIDASPAIQVDARDALIDLVSAHGISGLHRG